jgi:sterol desaturase/sphingolipid hydroxylase (fatty acid hydroxylase superfamily)
MPDRDDRFESMTAARARFEEAEQMVIAVVVFVVALFMMGVELRRPGRSFPQVTTWYCRALLFNGVQAVSLFTIGAAADRFFSSHRMGLLTDLKAVPGALVGYVVHAFVYYWWHRWRHEVPFLWRHLHQFHHSPQRIEIVTSFYKHPTEIGCNALLSGAVLYGLLGLSREAATGAFLLCGLAELFYHWNVSTPRWLGFFIQRPESHCVHHQEGLHAFNYGDLPVFDWLFGTFRNPDRWHGVCGLGAANELRLRELLSGVDVTTETVIAETRGEGGGLAIALAGLGLLPRSANAARWSAA